MSWFLSQLAAGLEILWELVEVDQPNPSLHVLDKEMWRNDDAICHGTVPRYPPPLSNDLGDASWFFYTFSPIWKNETRLKMLPSLPSRGVFKMMCWWPAKSSKARTAQAKSWQTKVILLDMAVAVPWNHLDVPWLVIWKVSIGLNRSQSHNSHGDRANWKWNGHGSWLGNPLRPWDLLKPEPAWRHGMTCPVLLCSPWVAPSCSGQTYLFKKVAV